jgi:ABC-type branched-subunit amino acid transport system substrate-binding protein
MSSNPVKCVVVAALLAIAIPVLAENGVSEKEIVIGQSCALTGPAEALGQGMKAGLQACIDKVNEGGGINGRTIRLISEDDGYEPDKAIAATRKLVEQDKVFILIGEVGTPTSKAVIPIVQESKTPFFGPFTGAEFLRNPYDKLVVNVRGSYYQEMEKLAAYLVDQKGLKKIACFYQNDGYGQAGLSGIEIALKKRSLELAAKGTYERNSVAVKNALVDIRKAEPEAVVMVGAYKPCAEFIKLAKKLGMEKVVFCNISFVGTKALQTELGADGEDCIISQVVTFPWDDSIAIVKEYQESLKKYQPKAEVDFVSLEGYMVGKLFCQVVEKTKGELTRDAFLQTISDVKTFDLGGVALNYGAGDSQGMDAIFLTVIKGGKIEALK